jgi:hypothetical protein
MKFKSAPTFKKSVMFSAHFEDGRTGYFVVMGHGGPEQDFLALSAATGAPAHRRAARGRDPDREAGSLD